MLNAENITDLNQISLTGLRAIALIGLLIMSPRSMEEIKRAFVDMNVMEESQSTDVLRIDLNTIKTMGCEVSRSSKSTNYKYILTKHPFSLPITMDDYRVIKRIYDRIKNNVGIFVLIQYDILFKKIASFIFDEEIKECFLGISVLKRFKLDFILDLISDCDNERTIEIFYKKTASDKKELKEIIAQKVVFNNDKVYLYGYDINKKRSVTLNASNILSINSRKLTVKDILPKPLKIKFFLKDFGVDSLLTEENIVEVNDNGYLVEGNYFNEFLAVQRILSLGSNCTVTEPLEFRNIIISKLKEMRNIYEKK